MKKDHLSKVFKSIGYKDKDIKNAMRKSWKEQEIDLDP
jgi:hypothetical protein